MKLYAGGRAPNPRRVLWLMAEKGIADVEVVNLDLFGGEHRAADYQGRIGFQHVPGLELDDGTMITESLAIGRYLESLYPEPNLFGRDPKDTAVIEMWTRRCELLLANPLMMSVRHSHPAFSALGPQAPDVARFNRGVADEAMVWLDRQLASAPFIAGERVTMADIVTAVAMDFAKLVKLEIPAELPHLARWREEIRQRPASKAGL